MEQKILIFKNLVYFLLYLIFSFEVNSKEIFGLARVIDGDTIHINNNKIRLHGIDAPEIDQTCNLNNKKWNCGQKSKQELIKLTSFNDVKCNIKDTDRYGRFIAVCFSKNININKYMVRNGWAIAYKFYSKDYIKEEKLAIKNQLGIWTSEFIEPYLYRKNK
ncbi:MAG: hypothetical protein CFH19_00594 [Alphaproteobacteria bacterium MarineAlpha5_Bin9]|mgnify:CR=1 FL=1|nr:MAG: hypothetical protein CFH19_00594 [Alphaproteobacteria bacterium MarineAlpha5_Bin9]|tara:strand:- start:6311 stop:6796 length:486 start_codon:yes stop_codon:yes gene_type:complete